jgi:hypothetical protein
MLAVHERQEITIMCANCFVGRMNWAKLGFTVLSYCSSTCSTSRFLSTRSLLILHILAKILSWTSSYRKEHPLSFHLQHSCQICETDLRANRVSSSTSTNSIRSKRSLSSATYGNSQSHDHLLTACLDDCIYNSIVRWVSEGEAHLHCRMPKCHRIEQRLRSALGQTPDA